MSERTVIQSGGISGLTLLTIVFIVLKLLGHISWSWWWVLAPTWMPIALVLSTFACVFVGAAILVAIDHFREKQRKGVR